ncbi:MAG: hypothetical protein D6788_08775 [Planctomycetota bacterium]|nr:MAG: hypothetical protein D6788_08775 [Planctomycetota bacterium]
MRVRVAGVGCLVVGIVCAKTAGAQADNGMCGPKFLLREPDRAALLVLCEKRNAVLRFDLSTKAIVGEVAVAEQPVAAAIHPDGTRWYVSCRRGQEVMELDRETLAVRRRFRLRGDPTGVAVSEDGRRLYVGVHSLDQVAVLDLESGKEQKRLAAGNGPEAVVPEPSGGRIYVTNLLSDPVPPDRPCRNEITVIDDRTARVVERIILEGANIGRGMAFTPDGSIGVAAISRPKNLVPMVQVARGWVVTNGFVLFSPGRRVKPVQLLVDRPNRAFADPYGVAITPDGTSLYLTCAGVNTVVAVDLQRVMKTAAEARAGKIPRFADHLGLSRRYVTATIPVGANPQALALEPDGSRLYVGNRLDDTVSVIDTASKLVIDTFVLGTPARSHAAEGERYFHSAARTFQQQFSCSSCHPDNGFDGLVYDLEPDGLGQNLVENRNLRGMAGTNPFKWIGSNPDITTQCGSRTAKWIVRTGWLDTRQVVRLAAYIRSIPPAVNPYRPPGGGLTDAQRRGKALFERKTTNDGTPIPQENRCSTCHAGPKFTDGRQTDVGTKGRGDTHSAFDTAHLIGVFESAPYLHDGRAATLEEIWTLHNAEDKHGVSSDWTKRQLNDLVEYLKSL